MSAEQYKISEAAHEALVQSMTDTVDLRREIRLVRAMISKIEADGPTVLLERYLHTLLALTKAREASDYRNGDLVSKQALFTMGKQLGDLLVDALSATSLSDDEINRCADRFMAAAIQRITLLRNPNEAETNRIMVAK